jgi:hypothetical protein
VGELRHVVTLSPEVSEELRERLAASDARLAKLAEEDLVARGAAIQDQARARIASGELRVKPKRRPKVA